MTGLLGDAKDLCFNVVVHVVGGVAIAVKADVLGIASFGVDEFTEAGFDVGLIIAFAHFGGVVVVVVEKGGHAGSKFRVVGDLYDDVVVGAFL